MSNGFLDDLPDLGLPEKRRKKHGPAEAGERAVRYVRPRCPKCGGARCPVYDSSHLPVRYHKCADCGHGFKSIEENYKPS